MVHSVRRAIAVLVVGCGLLGSSTSAIQNAALKNWTTATASTTATEFDAQAFLRTYGGFSSQELARVAAGTAVGRSLATDSDEVAVAAAVFMAVPRQVWVERFRDIKSFKLNPAVLAIGRFGSPPSAADLGSLPLQPDDFTALRRCRAGDCDVRLDQAGMARIQGARLQGAGAQDRAATAVREYLAGYAADYLRRGDAALMEYNDRQRPHRITAELATIIHRSPYLARELSGMRGDVAGFGGVGASANDHFLYWSVEKIASTPTTSITHAIIATPAAGLTGIATRQIYASHFFYASLGLTLLADSTGATGPGVTVIYINRSRVDAFSGLLGPVKRAAVRSRARIGAERLLRDLRTRLERAR